MIMPYAIVVAQNILIDLSIQTLACTSKTSTGVLLLLGLPQSSQMVAQVPVVRKGANMSTAIRTANHSKLFPKLTTATAMTIELGNQLYIRSKRYNMHTTHAHTKIARCTSCTSLFRGFREPGLQCKDNRCPVQQNEARHLTRGQREDIPSNHP